MLEFCWTLGGLGSISVRNSVYVLTVGYNNRVNCSSAWDIRVVNFEILCQAITGVLAKVHLKINFLIFCLDY